MNEYNIKIRIEDGFGTLLQEKPTGHRNLGDACVEADVRLRGFTDPTRD